MVLVSYTLGTDPSFGANCSISGPDTKATLSLYADTILLGFVLEVFLSSGTSFLQAQFHQYKTSIENFMTAMFGIDLRKTKDLRIG